MSKMSEPLILAVETSTRAGSVSLSRGEEILGATLGDASSSHSTDLIDNIESVLREGNARLSEVDLFAVTVGPGSFTGLRIGLATVKAFAVCVEEPCAPVSTLAAVAHAAGDSERTLAILPAGRGEVYAQAFSVRGEVVLALDRAAHLKPSDIIERYGEADTLKLAGDGAHQHIETLRGRGEGDSAGGRMGWTLAAQPEYLSNSVAGLALAAYRNGQVTDAEGLRADYVRASDAEINERWLQQNR